MLSCGSLTEIGSFDKKRKPFVLFLGPFRGPFFHQGLEWFLFVLFFTVLAFTHVSLSLHLSLIGCAENNALPIDLCRLKHLHCLINDHRSFLDFLPLPHGQGPPHCKPLSQDTLAPKCACATAWSKRTRSSPVNCPTSNLSSIKRNTSTSAGSLLALTRTRTPRTAPIGSCRSRHDRFVQAVAQPQTAAVTLSRSGEASPAKRYDKFQVEDHHLFREVAEKFPSMAPQSIFTTSAPPRLTCDMGGLTKAQHLSGPLDGWVMRFDAVISPSPSRPRRRGRDRHW